MPCFALGRAQELLLILNEYWSEHPELKTVPIVYSGTLAQKALEVFKNHRNMMSENTQRLLEQGHNPFKFQPKEQSEIENETGPLVVMAGPGMLQSGLSKELFLKWAPDSKNGIVFTGYSVDAYKYYVSIFIVKPSVYKCFYPNLYKNKTKSTM